MSGHEKISYRQALEELESIIQEMESQDPDIDALTQKVKRAAFLLRLCKSRLRKTEEEVKSVLADIENEARAPDTTEQEPPA